MKKVFIVSAVFFGVVLIFWGIYNFAFRDDSAVKKEDVQKEKDSEAKPIVKDVSKEDGLDAKIKDISEEGTLAPIFEEEGGKIIFYATRDGRVFSVNSDGSSKNVFSTQTLSGITKAIWSPDQKKVISEFDGGLRRFYYNYESKSGKPLNDNIQGPVWSNLGDKIFYQYKSGKINELDWADPDGSNWKKITEIRAEKAKIAPIPQTSLITFWNYPKNSEETSLLSVGVLGGEVKKIFSGKFGADYLWSPDGKKGLISFVEANAMRLGVIDYDGANFQDLEIPTLVSKCVWSKDGKVVFYALPGGTPEGAILPDDYNDKKIATKDTFWKANLENGEKTRLIELEDLAKLGLSLDAENLFLSANEKNLFFTNRSDGHLFRLSLPK